MHILIILANPRQNSFSHQIAEAYKEGAEDAGKTVTLLDLYQTELQLDFLRPESREEFTEQHPIRQELQAMIRRADELVIIHPLWWGRPPAILKNFIDQTFTPGFAYKHAKAKKMVPDRLNSKPKGLLKGRSVRLFITCDGQKWTNILRLVPYLSVWYFYIVRFAGMRLRSFHLFDYMRRREDITRNKWLAKVNSIGQKTKK